MRISDWSSDVCSSDLTGLAYRPTQAGEKVAGVVRQRLALASGRFAMIDDGLGFRLVPWASALEQQLGRQVAGVVPDGGGIDLALGRTRDHGMYSQRGPP